MNENDRSIVGFVMAGHCMVHTYEMSIPILMTVWLLEFSVTSAVLGAVVTIGYATFGVGALPGGLLVDRFGSRSLIVASLAGMAAGFVLLSFALNIFTITVALAAWGIAASVYHPAGLALISTGVNEQGTAFAYHGMAGNLGIAFGPFLTALLLLALDWRTVTAVLAIPALAFAVTGLVIDFDETAAVDQDGRSQQVRTLNEFVSRTRNVFTFGFLLVLTVVMFNGLYYRGALTFLPDMLGNFIEPLFGSSQPALFGSTGPLATEFDLAQYLYVGLLTVGIGGQYVGGRLTDRIEPEYGLGIFLMILACLAVVFVPAAQASLLTLALASVALGFCMFAIQPIVQASIAKYSSPESVGLSFGYTYLAIFGIGALGAAIVGSVLTFGSALLVFLLLAGFAAIGSILVYLLLRYEDSAPSL